VNVISAYQPAAFDDVAPGQMFWSAHKEEPTKLHLRAAKGHVITFINGNPPILRQYNTPRTILRVADVLLIPGLASMRWGEPQVGEIFFERDRWAICVELPTRQWVGVTLADGEMFSVEDSEGITFRGWKIFQKIDRSAEESLYEFPPVGRR